MEIVFNYIATLFVLIGTFFMVVSAIGILRLPDFYIRMSAITKAGTLGIGFIVFGIGLHFNEMLIFIKTISIIIFILLTSPVAAHVIGQAATKSGIRFWGKTDLSEFEGYLKKNREPSEPTKPQEREDAKK